MIFLYLISTFFLGNALKVPQIGDLGDFRSEHCNTYVFKSPEAHTRPESRVLTYHSPKPIHERPKRRPAAILDLYTN